MTTTVFVTQEVATVDYTPAIQWGELHFVTGSNDRMSPIPQSLNNKIILDKIDRELEHFKTDDVLVCSGSPAIMTIIAAKLGEKLTRILAWDGRSSSYFEIKI